MGRLGERPHYSQETVCTHAAADPSPVQVEGRPDIVIDLSQPGAVEHLKEKSFTIKEGATFRIKVTFKVQHQVLSGLKYVQVVKRMGVSNKTQEMIVGSLLQCCLYPR